MSFVVLKQEALVLIAPVTVTVSASSGPPWPQDAPSVAIETSAASACIRVVLNMGFPFVVLRCRLEFASNDVQREAFPANGHCARRQTTSGTFVRNSTT